MLVTTPARLASSMAQAIAQKLLRVASARLRPSVKPWAANAAMSTSPAPVRGLAQCPASSDCAETYDRVRLKASYRRHQVGWRCPKRMHPPCHQNEGADQGIEHPGRAHLGAHPPRPDLWDQRRAALTHPGLPQSPARKAKLDGPVLIRTASMQADPVLGSVT